MVFEHVLRGCLVALASCALSVDARAQVPSPPPPAPPPTSPLARGAEQRAQEAPLPAVLTLTAALARAEARAPEVAYAQGQVRMTSARVVGAGTVVAENPRLLIEGRPPLYGGGTFPGDTRYAAQLGVMLEVGGAPSARVDEVGAAVGVARGDLAIRILDAKAAAYTAYVRARLADRRIEEYKALLLVAERVNAASTLRQAAGSAGDIELSLSTAELFETRAQIVSAERERERAMMELRAALDLKSTEPLTLSTVVAPPPAPGALAQLVAKAETTRPELALVAKRAQLLDATETRLRRERFPKLGVYVGIDHAPVSPAFGQVGAIIEIPAFRRNQGPLAEVTAQREAERVRLDYARRQVAREVEMAHVAYERRLNELTLLTERVVPQAKRTLELVEIGWRAGRFDVFRVTAAARDLARAKGLELAALEASWIDRVALARATGEVTP